MSKSLSLSLLLHRPLPLAVRASYIQKIKTNLSANEKKLIVGVDQKNNVVPRDYSLEGNPRGVGFVTPAHLDSNFFNGHSYMATDLPGRVHRIFLKDTNHMHNVPVQPGGQKRVIQFERKGAFKTPCMGWTFVTDTFSKRELEFNSLDDAIEFCRENGYGYEVSYPRFRYHMRKSYADNFKWKGVDKDFEESF